MMRRARVRYVLVLAGACLAAASCATDAVARFALPSPTETGAPRSLWATYYHVYPATETADGAPLLDMSGKQLTGNLAPRDWCLGAVEGTINVTNAAGTVTYNYAGRADTAQLDCAKILGLDPNKTRWANALGKSRYRLANGPYGDGIQDYRLVPFRSIAVDPTLLPFGSVIFVPAAKGTPLVLPSGEAIIHDGYFFAADKGGAIKGTHIDVFCGLQSTNCFPQFVSNTKDKPFEAFVVDGAKIIERLRQAHLE
jgi:3D (Asp-Asp-Asp) domain-containing protein